MQSEDTTLINESDDKIADDEQDVRKKPLDSLDAVKCFAEITKSQAKYYQCVFQYVFQEMKL